jgi:lipoprotein Spr
MQAVLTFEEPRQKMMVPKQVIGLTAILLTGAAITPVNIETAQRAPGMETAPATGSIADLPRQTPSNLKVMELRSGSEVLPPVNVCTLSVIENKRQIGELRDKIVSSVLCWEGIKYKWGGQTKAGVDCSGLVQRVYRDYGFELPRTSYEQFRVGVGIPRAKLEPGDLVFFNTNGAGASHVGIYLGEGQFISATRYRVEIQSLDQPYWNTTYRGSRRVIV